MHAVIFSFFIIIMHHASAYLVRQATLLFKVKEYDSCRSVLISPYLSVSFSSQPVLSFVYTLRAMLSEEIFCWDIRISATIAGIH